MDKYFDFIFEHENLFIIVDNDDKTWFAANDVASILEYKAPQRAIEKYVPTKYKKQYQNIDVDNKKYNKKYQNKSTFIDEIGLFRVSMNSKQEKAIKFQEWITDIVLPELKRTGVYKLKNQIKSLKEKMEK